MESTIALAVVVPLVVGAPFLVFLSGTLLNERHPDVVALALAWWLLWVFAVFVLTLRVLLLDRFIRQSRATSIVLMSGVMLYALINGMLLPPLTFSF